VVVVVVVHGQDARSASRIERTSLVIWWLTQSRAAWWAPPLNAGRSVSNTLIDGMELIELPSQGLLTIPQDLTGKPCSLSVQYV